MSHINSKSKKHIGKYIVLVNKRTGKRKNRKKIERIEKYFKDFGEQAKIYDTRKFDWQNLNEATDTKAVVVAGGDGSQLVRHCQPGR